MALGLSNLAGNDKCLDTGKLNADRASLRGRANDDAIYGRTKNLRAFQLPFE